MTTRAGTLRDGAFTTIRNAHPRLGPASGRLRQEESESAALREEVERVVNGLENHFAYAEANTLPPSAVPPRCRRDQGTRGTVGPSG
ncbi:MAG TPA: hypothetical protein VFG15_29695 [Amycolatopsis sp.]|nr:hypothetical protein [Amycolatopsis sp.]